MRLKDLKSEDYHIYVDLDGVLADLQNYVDGVLGEPGDLDNDDVWKKLREMGEPKFDDLELLPDAMTLWDYVKKYNPNILTATGHPVEKNEREKRRWVKDNLAEYNDVFTVVASRNKSKWAWPDAILIDDRMKSIEPWREKGGIGILHTSAEETIAELKELGL